MLMKIKLLFSLCATLLFFSMTTDGNEELFANESKLNSCRLDIPLTYGKRDDKIVAEKAQTLKGKELVLLRYDKKSKEVTYKRYYLESETKGSTIYNYLIARKNYLENKKTVLFLNYKSKYDRFYLSECFDEIVSADDILKKTLKEVE